MFRVGVIGLGFISETHLQGFSKVPGVEIGAVADISADRLDECAAKYDAAHKYQDYNELLRSQSLDLVVISLPNSLHAKATVAALENGHNVLCEKPMATTLADAEAMVEAARSHQLVLSIAMNFRWQFFGPDIFHLKRLVEAGELGEIYYLRAQYLRQTTFPASGFERWNLSHEASGGGALIDLGPHMLDLAMWLTDSYEATRVSGITHHGHIDGSEVDDFASGVVTLSNGTRLNVELAWNSHNEPKWQIDVYGEKGGAVINALQPSGKRLTHYSLVDGKPACSSPRSSDIRQSAEASLQEHVVKRMMASNSPDCSAERALQVMRVINAWYQSAATGAEVVV